jgi:formylglycine-generating enzyme required for sulfatase activity
VLDLGKGVTATLIQVPAGKFLMGSPESEPGRWKDEIQREVEIAEPYWCWETPTTQEQFHAVMGTDPSAFKGPKRPVECVSWFDCVAFCDALTRLMAGQFDDLEFGLPTEEQWEYACRAGTTGPLNVEGATLDQIAWFTDNSGGQTHDVGLKLPNAWGFYDMLGNVCEWCADEWVGA